MIADSAKAEKEGEIFMENVIGSLKSAECVKRNPANPVLSKKDIPYIADLVFNAGVAKKDGKYYMLFRDDYVDPVLGRGIKTYVGVAESDDGVKWSVRNSQIELNIENEDGEIERFYDPRLIVIENEFYACFAVDTHHGIRGGVGKIVGDFESIDVLSLTVPDNRNLVLFPDKIDGKYLRLERPFPVYSRGGKDRFDMWISTSPDLKFWGESKLLLAVENVPFANDKIGPGAPPVKTKYGYLTVFHTVDLDDSRGKNGWEKTWKKRYCAGIMFLDLKDPSKILGISKEPLLAPEADYEIDGGFRNNVIFPGSVVVDGEDVKIYYGAADTVECLAEAKLSDLAKLCGLEAGE